MLHSSIAYSAVVDVLLAVKASDVTVSVSGNKHVSAKLKDSKVQITANKKAVRGSAASVVLRSTNAEGKTVKAVIKVKVQNKADCLILEKPMLTPEQTEYLKGAVGISSPATVHGCIIQPTVLL